MQSAAYLTVLCKLRLPVLRDAPKLFGRQLFEHPNQSGFDCFGSAVRDLDGQQKAAFSIHLRDKPCAASPAYHRIALPMPRFTPPFSGFRTLGDRVLYLIFALFIDFAVLFAPFPLPA